MEDWKTLEARLADARAERDAALQILDAMIRDAGGLFGLEFVAGLAVGFGAATLVGLL